MALYTRHQLAVILGLLAAFGGGLAVDRWRRDHPEAVARLERFDRQEAPHDTGVSQPSHRGASPTPSDPHTAAPAPGAGAAAHPALIDINRAPLDELARLPGIGPALARRIVAAREGRPFASIEDLRRVHGLGTAKLERLRRLVRAEPR